MRVHLESSSKSPPNFVHRSKLGRVISLWMQKNIMSLLMLGAGKGTTLRLVLDGADEEKALSEIQALFAAKFYEAE